MVNTVRSHFDSRATNYDGNRRYLIPNFDEFYSIGVDSLVCSKADPRVLDLGGGTGLLTLFLLRRYPKAHVTLLDFSEEMLTIARERYRNNPNIDFAVGDYRFHSLEGPFDIVISGLSIHHLSFEEKQELTDRIYQLLSATGEFLNVDLAKGENEQIEQEMHRRLDDFLYENLTEEQVQGFRDSQLLDIPVTINEQFDLMRKSGFTVIDCLYRYWIYGVFYGQK